MVSTTSIVVLLSCLAALVLFGGFLLWSRHEAQRKIESLRESVAELSGISNFMTGACVFRQLARMRLASARNASQDRRWWRARKLALEGLAEARRASAFAQ